MEGIFLSLFFCFLNFRMRLVRDLKLHGGSYSPKKKILTAEKFIPSLAPLKLKLEQFSSVLNLLYTEFI
jgi:hypothetical protein